MHEEPCFVEDDVGRALGHRALCEALGTVLLVLAAGGSASAAARLFPAAPGAALFATALALSGSLTALIVAFGRISGGHFNPLISGLQWSRGERTGRCFLAYAAAQVSGAVVGALLAARLWGGPVPGARSPSTGVLSEVVASAALMIVVFACGRARQPAAAPFAVGAWLFAAVLATPSTSYANPAVVVGAVLSRLPFGLPISSLGPFVVAEVIGAFAAFGVLMILFPPEPAR